MREREKVRERKRKVMETEQHSNYMYNTSTVGNSYTNIYINFVYPYYMYIVSVAYERCFISY